MCNGDSIEYKFDGLNETKTLLNGIEINQIMGRKLTEITMKNVPLFNKKEYFLYDQTKFHKPQYYISHFDNLKSSTSPFSLIISRKDFEGDAMFKTCLKVTLENFTVKEESENGNNYLVDLTFKSYVTYQNRKLKKVTTNTDTGKTTAKESNTKRASTKKKSNTYTIQSGDTLAKIAKAKLGNTKYWKKVYTTNRTVIEKAAKSHQCHLVKE